MISSHEAEESQGTGTGTAQGAGHLHFNDESPLFSMSKASDTLNVDSAISTLDIKAGKSLDEDLSENHEFQFMEPHIHDRGYYDNLKQLHLYLDMVSKIAKPGCSQEVLNVALHSMSRVVQFLSVVSSTPFPHSSL